MAKFEPGDQVYLQDNDKRYYGIVLEHRDSDGEFVPVRFYDNVGGCTCGGRGPNGHCMYVLPYDLRKAR